MKHIKTLKLTGASEPPSLILQSKAEDRLYYLKSWVLFFWELVCSSECGLCIPPTLCLVVLSSWASVALCLPTSLHVRLSKVFHTWLWLSPLIQVYSSWTFFWGIFSSWLYTVLVSWRSATPELFRVWVTSSHGDGSTHSNCGSYLKELCWTEESIIPGVSHIRFLGESLPLLNPPNFRNSESLNVKVNINSQFEVF